MSSVLIGGNKIHILYAVKFEINDTQYFVVYLLG